MLLDEVIPIIIVNWNGAHFLGRCLDALALQTYPYFQVIVVDNASTDNSAAMVTLRNDPRMTLLQLSHNSGFAAGNNLGMAHCHGATWVALLNPDAFPASSWLAELVAASKAYPNCAGFGAHLVDAQNPNISDGTGDEYHFTGRPFRRDHGIPVLRSQRNAGLIFAPCAAAALYRRSVWDSVGGMDEDYFCYLEDVDLAFRIQLQGQEFRYAPAAVCQHVGSALTGLQSNFSIYHGQRNLIWTFVKNMPTPLFWLLLPAHIGLNLLAIVRFSLRGQLRVVLRAKWDALRGLAHAWQKRKHIQARNAVSARSILKAMNKRLFPTF